MTIEKDLYFVAVKVFLRNQEGKLLITKDVFGAWDIPGGRLRENDFETSLDDVIERKMREELGDDVQYKLGEQLLTMRHERDEVLPSGEKEKRRIFALGYDATYIGGEIQLGKSHEKYEWISVEEDVDPKKYFTGGWLKGVQEYLSLI